ncbi:MAG TPA: hypothetical protein VGO11_02140 [Chthoniobacteraceae bacterium]|jgi:hypothetical protein|nr:hypothetical protein [Chthoniobacteraceae bacterium]
MVAKAKITKASEEKKSILDAVTSRTKVIALIVLVVQALFLSGAALLPEAQRISAFYSCAILLASALGGCFWIEHAEAAGKKVSRLPELKNADEFDTGSVKDITKETIQTLFARSANRCAFPGCSAPLVEDDNLLVGDICHIHGVSPNQPRYDPEKDDAYLRSHINLLLLCSPHHRRVDEFADEFSPEELRKMRDIHESQCKTKYSVKKKVLDESYAKVEADHFLGMFYRFPQMQTLSKVLQRWTWMENELPGEVILDAAAWICFVMADGDHSIFFHDLGPANRQFGTIKERFDSWKALVKEKFSKPNIRRAEVSPGWLVEYRELIGKILNGIQSGSI